jgi:hypothetical protein
MDIMAQLRVRIHYLHQSITFAPPDADTVPNMRGYIVLSKRSVHVPVTLVADPAPPLTGSMYLDTSASVNLMIERHSPWHIVYPRDGRERVPGEGARVV